MHKLQRKNALAALAQDMEEETSERTNVQTLNSPPQEEPKKTKLMIEFCIIIKI